jgi:hypothetical protein
MISVLRNALNFSHGTLHLSNHIFFPEPFCVYLTPTLAVHALLRDRHLDYSVALSCSSFVIRQQGSPSSQSALFLLPDRCRQDGGHTLSSDPARGAFHARGTRDFGVTDVQNVAFKYLSIDVFQGTTVPISTRFSMTAAPLHKTNSVPSIHMR